MNGLPVPGVCVMAAPQVGRTSFGPVRRDGTYDLKYKGNARGTLVGSSKLSLMWPTGHSGPPIPKEYVGVEFEVKPGENRFDFEMQSDLDAWKNFAPSMPASMLEAYE